MLTLLTSTFDLAFVLLLSSIFCIAGLHKFKDPVFFRSVLVDFNLLPKITVAPAVYLLASTELLAGIGLLIPMFTLFSVALITFLLSLYLLAILINLIRGRHVHNCGCGGPDQDHVPGIGLVIRNSLLLLAALSILAGGMPNQINWWLVLPMALFMIGLYQAGDQLLLNKNHLNRMEKYRG